MAGYRYTEAEAQRGWKEYWPTDAEYEALRRCKANWDWLGPTQSWCGCKGACEHGDRSWSAFWVERELTPEGYRKWVYVRAANNRFGYESRVCSACEVNGGGSGGVRSLMQWDGVPLRITLVEERVKPQIISADNPYRGTVNVPGGRYTVRRGA